MKNQDLYSIGAVERDTGIGRDTLRVWERRYGFPEPLRNDKGERIYTEIQLRQLQRIRRLLDQGMRPGKLLPLSVQALDELEAALDAQSTAVLDEPIKHIIQAVCSADAKQVTLLLRDEYLQRGMQDFILHFVAPLLRSVGELWGSGKLNIFQEHFLSQQLMRFLNIEIAQLLKSATKPRVLLTTLPGEKHTLGLLMVAALLASQGISSIHLGGEVPMDQIAKAVQQFQVDIVGITFSAAYLYKNIRPHLIELRALLPDSVEIWTGGEGVHRLRKLPQGVTRFNTLETLPV